MMPAEPVSIDRCATLFAATSLVTACATKPVTVTTASVTGLWTLPSHSRKTGISRISKKKIPAISPDNDGLIQLSIPDLSKRISQNSSRNSECS
jgi:hypothetical protein